MSTKPMLFSTDMVRALLNGRKMVTRRLVKPQPPKNFPYCHLEGNGLWYWTTRDGDDDMMDWWPSYERGVKPLYQPGDILYVRETWTTLVGSYIYKADQKTGMRNPGKWRPSIHMPKEAARIFLRVTDVRVERLRDITEDQARAEGFYKGWKLTEHSSVSSMATQAFMWSWDLLFKPADRILCGWLANPWVWVIEFKRISKEEAKSA